MDYKEYLDKARIKQLAELQARYNQVYAKERAEAASSLIAGHRQLRRGLQNVGLAGRKGNLISGREKTAALEARRRYREYNAGLSKAANTFTTAAGQRMARQAIDDENRVKRAEAYAKWGSDYEKAKAEAEAEYNAKLQKIEQEHLQYANEYQANYDKYQADLAAYQQQLAQYNAWLQQQAQEQEQQQAQHTPTGKPTPGMLQELIHDTAVSEYEGVTYTMMTGKEQAAAQAALQKYQHAQAVAQAEAQNAAKAQYAAQANPIGAMMHDTTVMTKDQADAIKAAQAARQQAAEAARQAAAAYQEYQKLQATIQRAQGITEPRTSADMAALQEAQYAQNKLFSMQQEAKHQADVNKWNDAIKRAEGITKPTNRYENEALKEAAQAKQQWLKYEQEQAALRLPSEYRNLVTLSDSEFAMRYDAAEKAYKQAVQNAQILRKDSSSSMDDLSSDANDIEAKATAEFVKWQNAAHARDDAMGAFYNESVNTNMKLVPHAPTWASEKDHDGKNYTAAMQNHWDATQYARSHDTDGSKYMPLVNEWSFINGRTALNYTQTHAVSNFVNNAASGGKKTQQYNAFVANCAAAFYNQPEGLTKNEREKMEAMLTLANLMTDEERARFNTILRQGGGKEADKYFEYLYASVLPQRFDSYVNNEMEFQTRDGIGKVFESVISIPVNLAQGVSGVIHTLSTGQEDPIAAKLAATKYNLAQGARDAVGQGISSSITNALMNAGTAEDFAQWAGSAGNFLYGTGMSMADSATVAAISAGIGSVFQGAGLAAETASKIGSAIGGSLLGASAFNSSYQEALNNGLDPQKARITAIGNGLNEMIFETLSIGTLLEVTGKETIKVGKSAFLNWLVNTAVQAGVEGSEEVFTDIGNKIWDNRINGIFSEEMQKIREYVASGMSFNEAKEKVRREFAEQLGMSFLGGAISGGFMGGGAQFVNMISNRQFEAYGKTLSQEHIDELKKYEYKSEQAQEILNSDKITNTDAAMLDIIRTQELVEESINYVEQAVAEGKMPQQIADIYKKFAEHNVQTETNPDGITDEEAEKMLPYVDTIKNAEAIKQGLGKIVEQQTAARKEFDALSPEQKQQRLQNITNETTALRNAPSLRVGASESRLSGQSAAQEFTTRAKTDTITLNNDGSVKTANGSVTFDFGANKTVDAMTDNQARAIRFAAAVANKTGVNIKVEQEFVGDDRNKNGEYNPETNTIRVNLSGTNSAIYTMSHELTHYLQSNNKQAFADLSKAIQKQLSRTDLVGSDLPTDYQDIIGDYLTGDNTLFEALCAYEKERYAKAGIQLTQDKVEEEVIARCCESFLGNSSLIADMTQNHTKSARAVYRFLNEIRADINALRADASERMAERGYASDFSPEQGMLEQFADIDKIVKLWENGLRKVAKKNKASGEKLYSLQEVEPVQPKSNKWQRTIDTAEAKRRFPTLWDVTADESEVRNPTQIAETVSTYRNVYRWLQNEGFNGTILDASSGLGLGTKAGREEFGFDVDDIEPYPDKSYKPKYTDYSKLNKKYDVIISNAVLNVIPQDQRDALVVKMGEMLKDGGRLIIHTRGSDVQQLEKNAANTRIAKNEYFVANTGSYQKGFSTTELKAYIQDALGDDFEVTSTNVITSPSVLVTKKSTMASLSDTQYIDLAKRYESGDKSVEAELRKAVDAAAKAAGYKYKGYHGTNALFNVFDPKKLGSKNFMAGSAYLGFFASASRETAESYTGLNDADVMSVFLGSEAARQMEAIKEQNGFDEADEMHIKAKEAFEKKYKESHGYNETVTNAVEQIMSNAKKNGIFNGQTEQYERDLAHIITQQFESDWNKQNYSAMQHEWEQTKEHKAYSDLNDKIINEWEQQEIKRRGYVPNVKDLYIKIDNPYIYDFEGEERDAESFAARMAKAKKDGNDGCIFKNVADGADIDTIYTVFSNTQFKSADLITKDDNGNIIPLSERFKTDRTGEDAWKNEDIRFSLKDNVERKGDLIAVHNLSGDQLLRSIELGGFPMPSIAVMKQSQGHDRYGDVSVIFNKDTIDPKKSTANKVYGGDAWTPTYPTVEYKPRKNVADRIEKTYYDIARKYGYDAARPLYSYVYELERKLNNAGSEKALLDDLYNDIDIMRMYGQINGKNRVEDVYQEKRTEMSASDRAVPEYFIKTLGEKFIKEFGNTSGRAAFEYKKQFVKDHLKELDRALGDFMRQDNIDLEQATYVLENMTTRDYMVTLQRALNIINNNAVKVERIYDRAATEQAIKDSIDEKAYKEWIYDLFHGIIEKSGIRNNKSYYTDSGNQRSWDALHEDETLENVVRVMRDMTDKGSNAFFSQSEMLALGTRNFKSISDIREHKDQLQHISDEEMSAAKTDIVNRFGDLMDEMRDKSESNYFIGRDRALQAMVEAVRKSRTPQGILNELKQWHGLNVTDDMGRRIADLLDEIADLPTEYFEAKPRRAVGIDEIKAVIMPIGEYADLKSQLDERGIPVVEYEKDNAEDRLRALNSDAVSAQRFSIMDKVRLSTSDGTRTFTYGDVTAKMYGNDVTLDGGKVRQRVQMLETLAERYDHVTVDASSEAEARAFENAGAKRVADEFSTGNEYGTYEFRFVESQFKRDSQFDAKQKANFAKEVLKQVGSRRNFTDQQMVKYRAALERAMTYLWNSTYGKGDQMAAYDAVDRLFDRILNGYSMMTEADADMRDTLMSQMRKLKTANGRTYYQLDVTETQMSEIRNAHGDLKTYTNLLSKALGARVTVKQVEGAKMLENTFTHAKDSRIKNDTVEGDMPGELLRLAQKTMEKRTNPYESESNERAAKKEAMWDAALDIIGGEKSTQQKIREAVKEARAAERKAAKDKTAKAIDEARLAERMHEGAVRARERRISDNRERALREHMADREARLKQQFRETTARTNEERLKRDMRKVALKWNQRLVKMLANPTEASHVPVQLAREVAELTKTITEYIDSGTERGRINLDKIAKAYQQAFDDQATIRAAKEENRKYDPRGSVIDREMYDEQLVNMIDEMNEILADKSFKELSAREMMGLLNIIRGVAHTVYDANRMIGTAERKTIWQVGDQMVKELESAPKIKGGFARFFLEESLDLRRIAKVFSGSNENAEFVKLSDMLNRGAIEKERVAQVLSGMFDPLTQQYGEEIRKWYGKNAEWIDTGITKNGRKVEITKGMRVSLAMHVLNAGNMRHIENGGVTIPNRELYAKGKLADAYANGTLVRLNADQINAIISQMTEAEKAYVEVAKEFFHQRTGYYVNKTSLQLLGYRKATVENYFPIHTDKNYTKSDFASVVRDGSIEGQGFLKERVVASNPVYLEDITSVVNRQIKGVSLYAGLAVPMRNFNAVMNASVYEDENGNWVPRTTVRKAMTQSMGEYGAKVVQGFLQDVSGMSAVDVTPGERLVAKLQTRYVKAVLLANLKVTLKQAASYPTAAAVIPWKYLSKALLKGGRNQRLISRADVDLINQYTPLYKIRLDGMANEITSIMAERGLEQKMPWLLGWITKMDVATVGRLWSACEYMVADQQNLPVGSDEYYKAVAEVFNQTIQQTQPNFTPLQRNAALRSKNPVVRTLTLFGTQRMQNGGILIESAMELAHSKNMSKEAQAAAKAKFGRAVVSQLVQNVMLVAIGFVVDALRGRMKEWQDDDKDVTLESVAKVMGDQFLGNIFGSFLGGSELWDIVSTMFKRATNANAYDTEFTVPSIDAIETIIGFFNKDSVSFVQYMSGDHTADEKITRLKNFSFKLAKAAGYLTGFPFENIAKTIVKGWIPALQDIYDATQTGELIPWLHQSGKLDSKKIAANYKAWTKAGYSGRDFFYWEKQLNGVSGGRDGRIPILLDSDLTNEQKALMMQMFDTADGYADGTVFYNKKGEAIIDFTAPSEKQQALPMPSAEPSAEPTATPEPTPTPEPTATPIPLSEKKMEGVQEAVKKGVPEELAINAFLAYQDVGKQSDYDDDWSRNDQFREWLFRNVESPEQRAILEYQVVGQAASVEGAVTYRATGTVYRDFTNEAWYELSGWNLAKDGTNKRYDAGKKLEETGMPVEKTVEIYRGLADYTKKAEWTNYMREQGLTEEQIRIILWSRGWAKMG